MRTGLAAGRLGGTLLPAWILISSLGVPRASSATVREPDLLLITVDTLRADRLSSAGYARRTTPRIDALLGSGARFRDARTVEPLTNPALTSLLASVPPHVHGATRNGIPAREDLVSLPRVLGRRGYSTAAILGNWTLRDELSGLARHWNVLRRIESRKRWFGLLKGEAVASDLTAAAAAWLDRHRETAHLRPAFLWVHFVEPHAPYRLHADQARRLGIGLRDADDSDRYDTEVAAVDEEIGRLLELWRQRGSDRASLIVFASDHGEAFGEDGARGHGRVLHEATLRVPLGFVWEGRIPSSELSGPATLLDVAPTVLGLLGLPPHPAFRGADWSEALLGGRPPTPRLPCFQAHRGAVQIRGNADRARRNGLLEVGVLSPDRLEVLSVESGRRRSYPAQSERGRAVLATTAAGPPSPGLDACLEEIRAGLERDDRPAPELSAESLARLRALGYVD